MKTYEETPWVDYITIKKNGKRKLKLFTPLNIRKAYKMHLKNIKKCDKQNVLIEK